MEKGLTAMSREIQGKTVKKCRDRMSLERILLSLEMKM